jgi:hypothetical protein
MAYAEGDFSFVEYSHDRTMLKSMYDAVTVTENWAKLRDAPAEGSFMFPNDPVVTKMISEVTNADKFKGHSGSSFACTIHCMNLIAKNGWDAYRKEYIKGNLEAKIQKLQTEYDEALLIYRAVWRRSQRQTNPQVKEYYEEITRKEKCILDAASYNLREAQREMDA